MRNRAGVILGLAVLTLLLLVKVRSHVLQEVEPESPPNFKLFLYRARLLAVSVGTMTATETARPVSK